MAKPTSQTRDADQSVATLTARGNELKTQLTQLERDIDAINAGIANARQTNALDDAARELLSDGVVSLAGATELQQQCDAVSVKLRIVRRAIEMNREDLDKAESAASHRIAESRKPEYVAIVREMKSAVVSLQSALVKEAAFCHRLDSDGGSMGNGILQPMGLGVGRFDKWLADAKEYFGI